MQLRNNKMSPITSANESVLVVKREVLFATQAPWCGLNVCDYNRYARIISEHAQFEPRALVESDPSFKQIIPYMVFRHQDTIFVVQRKKSASEQRLAGALSLGIGGHIRQGDVAGDCICDWAQREVAEELHCGGYKTSFVGFINDDTNPVGKVHFGVVYFAELNSLEISVKSELKQGILVPVCEVGASAAFEPWSRFVLDFLMSP